MATDEHPTDPERVLATKLLLTRRFDDMTASEFTEFCEHVCADVLSVVPGVSKPSMSEAEMKAMMPHVDSLEAGEEELHVDLIAHMHDPPRLLERKHPDDPTIGAQVRSGWATYVSMSEPHTMAECPFAKSDFKRAEAEQLVWHMGEQIGQLRAALGKALRGLRQSESSRIALAAELAEFGDGQEEQ